MKLYVDDLRAPPVGWELASTVDEAIEKLRSGKVTDLSLDYDLGGRDNDNGLMVLRWLDAALERGQVGMPNLIVHSGSILGRRRLEAQIEWLRDKHAC